MDNLFANNTEENNTQLIDKQQSIRNNKKILFTKNKTEKTIHKLFTNNKTGKSNISQCVKQ